MGQVPKCTGRWCWEIKVFFKSVLLFVQVLYAFVTYLLTYPRKNDRVYSFSDIVRYSKKTLQNATFWKLISFHP
jgi:hypothetical protein